jgi:hypothetical protein
MSRQIPWATRSLALVAALLVWGVGTRMPTNTAHADDCLTEPNSSAPAGSHWYYHLDRAKQRKCWYIGATGQPAQPVATQATSDPARAPAPPIAPHKPATTSASAQISPGDSTAPSPQVLADKPQHAPVNSAATGESVRQNAQKATPQVGRASSIPETPAAQDPLEVPTAVGQTHTTGPTADNLPPAWKYCTELTEFTVNCATSSSPPPGEPKKRGEIPN